MVSMRPRLLFVQGVDEFGEGAGLRRRPGSGDVAAVAAATGAGVDQQDAAARRAAAGIVLVVQHGGVLVQGRTMQG